MWLPYWLILFIYKKHKALPANIKTRTGRNLKAIMITTDYGVIFSEEKYVKNRLGVLSEKQKQVAQLNDELLSEINNLSFIQKEQLAGNLPTDVDL